MSLLVSQLAPSLSWLLGPLTVFFMAIFLGWMAWTWAPRNRSRLESFAGLPLDDDDMSQDFVPFRRSGEPAPHALRKLDSPLPLAPGGTNGGTA